MVSIVDRTRPGGAHFFHAAVLAGMLALFLCALLADYGYWASYQIQWSNFASWLLVGAMVLASLAVICEIIALVGGGRSVVHRCLGRTGGLAEVGRLKQQGEWLPVLAALKSCLE